jgi:maleate cis-trans isomerase
MERELIVKRIESQVDATEKRLGVIAPGGGKINEGEFLLVSPPSVSFLIIVLGLGNTRIPDVVAPPLIENAAQALTAAGADMILLGGLPVGFFQPRGYESELTTRITNACGLPAATMAGATVEALSRLNIKRPVVVSHYNDRLNAGLRSLLSAYGIEAATIQSINQQRSAKSLADQEATDLYFGLARKAYVEAGESDGFLISGAAHLALWRLSIGWSVTWEFLSSVAVWPRSGNPCGCSATTSRFAVSGGYSVLWRRDQKHYP